MLSSSLVLILFSIMQFVLYFECYHILCTVLIFFNKVNTDQSERTISLGHLGTIREENADSRADDKSNQSNHEKDMLCRQDALDSKVKKTQFWKIWLFYALYLIC